MTPDIEPGPLGLAAFRQRFDYLVDILDSYAVLLNTWSDTSNSFCVLYRWGTVPSTFGVRFEWRDGLFDSPAYWGEEMAQEVCEPLGTIANDLVTDEAGVLWWGAVRTGTPVVPRIEP